jgi:hypothetical protein
LRRLFAKIGVGECYGDITSIDTLARRQGFRLH